MKKKLLKRWIKFSELFCFWWIAETTLKLVDLSASCLDIYLQECWQPSLRSFIVHFDCFWATVLYFSGLSTVEDNMNHPSACKDTKNKAPLSLMEAAMSQTINLIGINRFAALFDLSISKKPSTFLKMGVSTDGKDENSFTLADRMEMASLNGCFAVYRSKVNYWLFNVNINRFEINTKRLKALVYAS